VCVDRPHGERTIDPNLVEVVAGDVPSTAAERERDGATDEAKTSYIGSSDAGSFGTIDSSHGGSA
jgi:hypothetical protein